MIKVTYRPKKHQLKITGHANSAEKGHDLICASVSMIFYNLCQMLLEYDQEKAFAVKPKMGYTSGSAYVEVTPRDEYEAWIEHDFLYACTGIRLLEAKYPEYVYLKITEK
ncbi:MAG: ribosomal-processing cysteine protease Prp [Acutalibacteraceae bacterium]